jgi:hypothetical protein
MGKRSKLIALTAVGALALGVSVAVAQSGTTQSKITGSFSPNTGGKPTKISFDVKTFSTTGGIPAPGSNAVVHLPKGLKYSANGFTRCNGNLQNPPSAANCPAKSKIGGGSSIAAAQVGSAAINENATVTAYAGAKQNGHDTLLLYAVGTTPISIQITLVGELIPGDASPYSYALNVPIPPIPTVPGGPNASITDFNTTIGGTAKFKGKKVALLMAPKKASCVGGLEHWGYDGKYMDGTAYTSTTTSPCPKK